jgi:hypothetical protein
LSSLSCFRNISPSLSHFCLLGLQHLLTYMFSSRYHLLWCLVCCWGWFCLSALADSTVRLPGFFTFSWWFCYMLIPMFLV